MNFDPRYSPNSAPGTTSVQLMDGRKSGFEIAIIGMLAMQFLLMLVFVWSTMRPKEDSNAIAKLESKIEKLESARSSIGDQELLKTISASITGDANLIDEFSKLQKERQFLAANVEGQLALANDLKSDKDSLESKLKKSLDRQGKVESQLVKTRAGLLESKAKLKLLAGDEDPDASKGIPFWMAAVASLATLGVGAGVGIFFANRQDDEFEDMEDIGFSPNQKTRNDVGRGAEPTDALQVSAQSPSQVPPSHQPREGDPFHGEPNEDAGSIVIGDQE